MNITSIRAAIADVLDAGLTGWNISSYVSDAPVPPALVVGFPTDVTYHVTQGGKARISLPVMVVAGMAEAEGSQATLADALSAETGSVVATLDDASAPANEWFGKLIVKTAGNLRVLTAGSADVLVADINLEFLA